MGNVATLQNLAIVVPSPAVGAVGTEVVSIAGAGFIDSVLARITADQADVANETLTAFFRGSLQRITRLVIASDAGYYPAQAALPELVGIDLATGFSLSYIRATQIQGIDVGIVYAAVGDVAISDMLLFQLTRGIDTLPGAGAVRVTNMIATAIADRALTIGAEAACSFVGLTLQGNRVAGSIAIEVLGTSRCVQVSDVSTEGFEQAYVSGAPGALANASLNTAGVWLVRLAGSDHRIANATLRECDNGMEIDLGAGRSARVTNVLVVPGTGGFVVRTGLDIQITNCKSIQEAPFLGTGLLVEAVPVDITVTNFHASGHVDGVDYAADYFTLVAANLRSNTNPLVVTGAPVSGLTGFVQV